MDQIAKIRKEKHQDYLRKTWLPEFFEKYKPYFDTKERAKNKIKRFFLKHRLPDVLNGENLEHIPGLFRVRLHLTHENLNKKQPKIHDDNDDSSNSCSDHDDIVHFGIEDADIKDVIKESMQEYKETFDKVLSESIKDNNDVDYDEYILNQAIMESLGNSSTVIENNLVQESNTNNYSHDDFYFVIDIRDYAKDFSQPIYVYGDNYYLNDDQINYLKKLWLRVGSLQYQQNFEYYKVLSKDICL